MVSLSSLTQILQLMKAGSISVSAVTMECTRGTQRTGSADIGSVQFLTVSVAVRCRLASAWILGQGRRTDDGYRSLH